MSLDVRPERTGWRDQEISGRHREWGFNCPAVDLDFLMVEYNFGKPVGLIEYKHFNARMPDRKHATYRALSDLADMYGGPGGALPFMIVFYWPDVWAFRVYPINGCAKRHFQEEEQFTEKAFVEKLYALRNFTLDANLLGKLHTDLPQGWEKPPVKKSSSHDDFDFDFDW